jgi:tRNA nucleotidyltransferase (CCA-adding enzyme)
VAHREIMKELISNGFNAWVVGGAVRDLLLGATPKDYDLATNAKPEEILKIFPGSKLINASFSVAVYVPTGSEGYVEVATLREESSYKEGRPTDYKFVDDIKVDLGRRDATINAMAMDIDGNVIDPYGGRSDLESKIVRAVGSPAYRIEEHPIRMMRYIRFASTLSFEIEPSLDSQIIKNAKYIRKEKWEAISAEFLKALSHKNAPLYLYMIQRYGILNVILPEVDRLKGVEQNVHHKSDVWMHTLFAIASSLHATTMERLAILLHDIGKPHTIEKKDDKYGNSFHAHEVVGVEVARDICKRLRIPNKETDLICNAVRWHMYPISNAKTARRFVSKVSHNAQERDEIEDRVKFVMAVRRADKFAHKRTFVDTGVESEESLVRNVLEQKQPFSVKDLEINGHDIMKALDIKQGKAVGEVLSHLLDLVISDGIGNAREDLLREAKEYYDKLGSGEPVGSTA